MEERPKINLKLSSMDKIIELLAWLFLLAIWGLTISSYSFLPDKIPIHYNGFGQVDGLGNKITIFTLPLISSIIFAGMTIINKFPHLFNYPINITQNNALQQYTNATRMIRSLKLVIVFVLGLIAWETIQVAHENNEGLGIWFLPLTLGLIFVPLLYFLLKSFKKRSND